jgi:septal ring factor EnvC (AmiA/AmiB activator)
MQCAEIRKAALKAQRIFYPDKVGQHPLAEFSAEVSKFLNALVAACESPTQLKHFVASVNPNANDSRVDTLRRQIAQLEEALQKSESTKHAQRVINVLQNEICDLKHRLSEALKVVAAIRTENSSLAYKIETLENANVCTHHYFNLKFFLRLKFTLGLFE